MTVDLSTLTEIGDNVKVGVIQEGGRQLLVFVVDPAKDLGPSSTGKMRMVASTHGWTLAPAGLKANVMLGKRT